MLPIFLYTYVPVALFLCVRQRGQRGQSSLLDVCLKSRPSGLQKARALPWPFFKPPFLCTLSEGPTFFSFLSTYHDARINVCVRTSVHRKGADFFKEPYTVFRSGINLKYKKKSFFSSSLSCTRTMKVQDRFAQRIIISQTCPPRCPCVDGNEIGNWF